MGGHDIICGLFPHLSNTHNGHAPLRMVQVVSAAATPNNGSAAERPLRLGVVLSGGQAPGAGLHLLQRGRLHLFVPCAPSGLVLGATTHGSHSC